MTLKVERIRFKNKKKTKKLEGKRSGEGRGKGRGEGRKRKIKQRILEVKVKHLEGPSKRKQQCRTPDISLKNNKKAGATKCFFCD